MSTTDKNNLVEDITALMHKYNLSHRDLSMFLSCDYLDSKPAVITAAHLAVASSSQS